jgi:4-hydroxy-tetrahydrodipicolinate synthase
VATFKPGLVHTPVTPFKNDESIDFDAYSTIIEFHLRHGAQSLALPMHAGESVSLSDAERRQVLEFALRKVNGRVPVIAHASESGTGVAAALAQHAAQAGATAVVATTPYYWTPPPAMLLEHFTQIGKAARVPFFIYNSPEEMGGVDIKTDLVLKLIERLDNFAGVVDVSMDWQFMIEVVSTAQRVRPAFQLLTGVEYMISAGAIGATSMFAPLAGICPVAVRNLWDICSREQYAEARPVQEAVAALRQALKPAGAAGLKSGMDYMQRNCGLPRPPLEAPDAPTRKLIDAAIGAIASLRAEPRGW